jgi:glycosyltransferase involved in cell wall biosynthesis
MKVLIDIRLLARGGTTGIPAYTRELINSFITHHPEHQYILFYNAFRRNPLPQTWRQANHVRIIEKNIPNRLLNLSYRLFNAPKLKEGADVIFSPHFNLLPHTSTPRVITFHDLSFLHEKKFFSGQQRFWHFMQQYKKQAQQATRLIAVSESTKDDLINFFHIREEKIKVVYSGIGAEFKKLDNTDAAAVRLGLLKPFILYLGTLETRKNVPALIRAFTLLKKDARFLNYELVLAGRPGYGYAAIKQEIARCKFKKDIRIFGPIADADRVYLYNLARVLVFPSWFEGFGFPPLEAQACGTPVIATDRSSLKEILGASAIAINPWRPAEIAESIVALETDTKLRNEKITAGLKNVKRFTWETAATETLNILQSPVVTTASIKAKNLK